LVMPANYDDNAAAAATAHYFPESDLLALELCVCLGASRVG
jgi:hypothetical protein